MRTITIQIVIIFLMVSCTSRTIYKKPENLIPKDQMIDLWVDIYIAKAAENVKNKKQERKVNYLPFIYDKYKIDSTRFMQSNIYYTSKIEEYDKMFKEVEERLLMMRDKADPDMKGVDLSLPREKLDSIRNVRKLEKNKGPVEEMD